MKANAKDNIAKLPYECFATLLSNNNLILLKAGEKGYFRLQQAYPKREAERDGITMDELADRWNAERGVTKGQREAMEIGSMHGWGVPGADPDLYTPEGVAIKEKLAEYEQ